MRGVCRSAHAIAVNRVNRAPWLSAPPYTHFGVPPPLVGPLYRFPQIFSATLCYMSLRIIVTPTGDSSFYPSPSGDLWVVNYRHVLLGYLTNIHAPDLRVETLEPRADVPVDVVRTLAMFGY